MALFEGISTSKKDWIGSTRGKLTAHTSAQRDAMLILSSLSAVQITSTVQKASLPHMVICVTPMKGRVTAELLPSGQVRNRRIMGGRQEVCSHRRIEGHPTCLTQTVCIHSSVLPFL